MNVRVFLKCFDYLLSLKYPFWVLGRLFYSSAEINDNSESNSFSIP